MKRDINDTLRDEGTDAVRARHDKAKKFQRVDKPDPDGGGTEARLRELIEQAPEYVSSGKPEEPEPQPHSDDTEIGRLAKLSALQYEQERKPAAEKLNVRASILDRLVAAERDKLGLDDTDKQGKPVEFPEIEPWPEKVDGAALLDEIAEQIGRYIIISDTDKTIAAIWPVHSHIYDRFAVTPRMCVRSPVKECGKSTLFSVVSHLVQHPLMAASVTPAVVFRIIERHRPSLLIDEAANMFDGAGELRRILNAGYRFDGTVLRSVGDDYEPRLFKIFAPVAFALIGTLPSDLHSRCLCINLKRKLAGEKVEPYRIGQMQHLDVLARKIVRWVSDNADTIAKAKPDLPANVINRHGDLWVVMLSIATVAGGDWPDRVKKAIAASVETGDDDATLLEKLLADIQKVFGDREAVSSAELVEELVSMEGRPWPELGKSHKPITQARLARMLRGPGFCVSPGPIRVVRGGTEVQLRGYTRSHFDDLFTRYLPSTPLKVSQCH